MKGSILRCIFVELFSDEMLDAYMNVMTHVIDTYLPWVKDYKLDIPEYSAEVLGIVQI